MPKPIVCPECIQAYQIRRSSTDNEDAPDEPDGQDSQDDVATFSNWRDYAEHILTMHPEATARVNWVISSVNDEVERCKELSEELPTSIKKLVDLIKTKPTEIQAEKTGAKHTDADIEEWQNRLRKVLSTTAGDKPAETAESKTTHPTYPKLAEYQKAKAEYQKAKREPFDQEKFNREWDKQLRKTKPKRNLIWIIFAVMAFALSYMLVNYGSTLVGFVFLVIGIVCVFLFMRKPKPKIRT